MSTTTETTEEKNLIAWEDVQPGRCFRYATYADSNIADCKNEEHIKWFREQHQGSYPDTIWGKLDGASIRLADAHIDQADMSGNMCILVLCAEGYPVATGHGRPGADYIHRNEEAHANARLMAASPDLLAALEALYGMIEQGKLVRDVSHDADPKWFLTALELARAAIAAATGQ